MCQVYVLTIWGHEITIFTSVVPTSNWSAISHFLNQYLYFSVKDSESDTIFLDCFAGKIANLHSKDAITFYVSESYKSVTKKGHFYGFVILCPLRELLT